MKLFSAGISLKTALIALFSGAMLVAAGMVGTISFYGGRLAVHDVARQLREEITRRIEARVATFLRVPHRINRMNAEALRLGRADPDDPRALVERFAEQVDLFPTVSSVYFGNARGGLANSGRERSDDARYGIETDGFVAGTFRKYALDARGDRGEELATLSDFDARTRPWYIRAAAAEDGPVWSDIYILFTGQDMALAAGRPAFDDRGHFLGVVSVDVFLAHIGQFLRELHIGRSGRAFILERSGLLVASSNPESPIVNGDDPTRRRRRHGSESEDPLIRAAVRSLAARFGGIDRIDRERHLDCRDEAGEKILIQASPLRDEAGLDWLVVVAAPEAEIMARIASGNRIALGCMAASLVLSLLAGAWLARGIIRPIGLLESAASRWGDGESLDPIEESGRFVEVRNLTRSFNRMARRLSEAMAGMRRELDERRRAEKERERLQTQLLHAHKMEAVGTLAGGVAHDFNNLLQAIGGYTQLLLIDKEVGDPDRVKLEIIETSVERAARLVRQLLLFGRKTETRRKPVDPNREVAAALGILERTIPRMIRIETNLDPSIRPILADPVQVGQVLLNLGTNAADAMAAGGVLRIETRIPDPESAGIDDPDAPPGGWVRVTVSDTGTGMDEETRTHIFDPFFTTKEIGKGTGLGLASVYGIVKGHGGRIRCESEPGRGTTFHIDWPAVKAESSGEAASAPSVHGTGAEAGSEARGGGETVLVVDDEDDIRELTAGTLEARGYAVLRAAGGEEALERYAGNVRGIHLVVLDLGMPGMGGMRCLEALRRMDPGVRVIVASGYSDAGREAQVREAGAVGFVAKPFQARELLLKVREALDKGGAGA